MREQEGLAAQVLLNEGLKLKEVRDEVVRLLASGIRSTYMTAMQAFLPSRAPIDDLPEDVIAALADLDAEIDCLNSEKEAAIAAQNFQKAAALRDRADELKSRRRATLVDWGVNHPLDPSWLTKNDAAVLKLAQRIREHRCWNELPNLADALEQAGCTHRILLNHCRKAGQHADQCWVVELLLASV